jgi:hypothetical protein
VKNKGVNIWVLLAVGTLAAVLCGCHKMEVSHEEIQAFIDDYEHSAEFLDRQEAVTRWEYSTTGYSDSLKYYHDLASAFASRASWYVISQKYLELTDDKTLLAKLELIHRRSIRGVIDHSGTVARLMDSLAAAARQFQPVFESKPAAMTTVAQVLVSDSNRFRRQDAWMAMAALGDQSAGGITVLVKLRNRAAARIGFNSYYDLMLAADGLDKSEYLGWLREWDRMSAEPYRRALDSVTRDLGVGDLRPWDIEFARGNLITAEYYPIETNLPRLKNTLNGIGFDLDKWPIYLSAGTIPAGDPSTGVFLVHIPDDIRVVVASAAGAEPLGNLFSQAGKALYAAHIDRSDFLLANPPAPCFEWGMGKIMQGLTELDAWQLKYASIPEPSVIEAAARRRFMQLYDLRLMLVNVSFEYEMYKNPTGDLHQVYRELFERYLMFPYPENVREWAVCLDYIVNPVGMQNRLVGTAVAAHIYHYLMKENGAVLDQPQTGEFLAQNLWRSGGAHPWQDLLQQATGEQFNPRYLLEYPGL